VQHLDTEEGELTVLDELTQVSKARLTCIRDLLQKTDSNGVCGKKCSKSMNYWTTRSELTVLDELTQVSKALLTCVRDLLRKPRCVRDGSKIADATPERWRVRGGGCGMVE
jgi:hypothetical protein